RDWSSDVCSSDLLVLLTREHEDFLLGQTLEATGLLHRLELLEPLQTLVDGLEVGQHAAEPALVDIRHADAGRLLGDGLLRLLLGDRQSGGAAGGDGLVCAPGRPRRWCGG